MSLGARRSYPIASLVAREGIYCTGFDLIVDEIAISCLTECEGSWTTSDVCSLLQISAVALSNWGAMEWSLVGGVTLNSNSSLLSASMRVVGKAIVQLLFCECS